MRTDVAGDVFEVHTEDRDLHITATHYNEATAVFADGKRISADTLTIVLPWSGDEMSLYQEFSEPVSGEIELAL